MKLLISEWVELSRRFPRFKYWLRFWSANFLHFVREPRHVELCRDPRFDSEALSCAHHVLNK
jgi:hypothetical protein